MLVLWECRAALTRGHRKEASPADTERELSSQYFQGTGIVAMNRKAAGMTAGTGKSVERQAVNKIIIKNLSKRIVIFDKYGFLLLLLIVTMI